MKTLPSAPRIALRAEGYDEKQIVFRPEPNGKKSANKQMQIMPIFEREKTRETYDPGCLNVQTRRGRTLN